MVVRYDTTRNPDDGVWRILTLGRRNHVNVQQLRAHLDYWSVKRWILFQIVSSDTVHHRRCGGPINKSESPSSVCGTFELPPPVTSAYVRLLEQRLQSGIQTTQNDAEWVRGDVLYGITMDVIISALPLLPSPSLLTRAVSLVGSLLLLGE